MPSDDVLLDPATSAWSVTADLDAALGARPSAAAADDADDIHDTALVAVVAWYGFRFARRAFRDGDRMTGIALTGLMAVLLSPVAWIHHLAWIVVVLGAVVGTGRDPARLWLAGGIWLYYVLTIPWWGVSLRAAEIPVLSPVGGRIVQDAFGIGAVVIGESRTFHGGHDWLAEHGVEITILDDPECVALMTDFIAANPQLWNEDIGEPS